MHIAVDLDDVVLDFVGGVRRSVKSEFGIDLPDDAIDRWDLHEILDPIIGRSWWSWLRDRDWIWATFPAIDGAMGGLEQLRRDGHYLECVTSKPRWAEYNVWKWIGKWRPPFQRVTITGPDEKKVDWTNAEILIDDKPQNIQEFAGEYRLGIGPRMGIIFDRPHNRSFVIGPHRDGTMFRAEDWREVVARVKEISA